jgi:1,2-diacylglycerol 3-alpha-glucosyltransferase
MNICIVTSWFSGGGAAEVSLSMTKVLNRFDHKVFIYARNEYAQDNSIGIDYTHAHFFVHEGRKSFSPLIKSLNVRDFLRFLNRNQIEVVIFNEQVDLTPVLHAKKLGIRCIAYVDYYREDTVDSFAIYDSLICSTKRHFSVFEWHPNAWFLPWGVDSDIYEDVLPSENSTDYPFFHSCSSSPHRKGTDILLQAMEISKDLRCTIHSFPELSVLMPKYSELIAKLKFSGQLLEINKLVRQPGLYHLGQIYVYPTRLEGIGLSILESSASGLYLVATNIEPISEFATTFGSTLVPPSRMRSRSDGYYWPLAEVDPRDLANAMVESKERLKNNPDIPSKIRNYVRDNRDIYSTHASLSDKIKNLRFTPIRKEQLQIFYSQSTQKFPITFKGRTKRFLYLVSNVLRFRI